MYDYIARATELEKEALKVISNSSSWHYMKTQSGVKMYYKASPHFNGNMYKFEVALDLPYKVVYEVMYPPKTTKERLSWDKSLKHYERLVTVSEDLAVGLLVTPSAALGMISKREFVDLYFSKTYATDEMRLHEEYGEMCWIFAESIDVPSRPITDEFVRGTNYPGGYVVAQNIRNPEQCFVELYVNCDIGGMVPRSLIEKFLPYQQVHYIESLKAEAKRRLAMK